MRLYDTKFYLGKRTFYILYRCFLIYGSALELTTKAMNTESNWAIHQAKYNSASAFDVIWRTTLRITKRRSFCKRLAHASSMCSPVQRKCKYTYVYIYMRYTVTLWHDTILPRITHSRVNFYNRLLKTNKMHKPTKADCISLECYAL